MDAERKRVWIHVMPLFSEVKHTIAALAAEGGQKAARQPCVCTIKGPGKSAKFCRFDLLVCEGVKEWFQFLLELATLDQAVNGSDAPCQR